MEKEKRIIIALGGNALLEDEKCMSFQDQLETIRKAIKFLLPILENVEYEIVIVHGNGPQSGALLERNECVKNSKEGKNRKDHLTLNLAVASTQATIGSMISRVFLEERLKNKNLRPVSVVLTQVEVAEKDLNIPPSKPVGPHFYLEMLKEALIKSINEEILGQRKSKEEIEKVLMKALKEQYEEENPSCKFTIIENKSVRRVVLSPPPIHVVEFQAIKDLMDQGYIPICCGGGGIPMVLKNGSWEPVEAVVDKDLAAAQLGEQIQADMLLILTKVENVYLNYGDPHQEEALTYIPLKAAKEYLAKEIFPKGSMRPKIEAAVKFIESGGKKVIITSLEKAAEALAGRAGTRITL